MIDTKVAAALAAEVSFDDGSTGTLRDYLKKLLVTLWIEEESFSGKRPFGNSGWQTGVYCDLVKASVLDGVIDEDGYLEEVDYDEGETLVLACIEAVFER